MKVLVIYLSDLKEIVSVQDVPGGITQVIDSQKSYVVEDIDTLIELYTIKTYSESEIQKLIDYKEANQ